MCGRHRSGWPGTCCLQARSHPAEQSGMLVPMLNRSLRRSMTERPSATRQPAKQTLRRKVAAACIVAAGAILISAIYSIGLTDKNATERDYIQYWAAGQLLVHHANPYSLEAILKIEQAVGLEGPYPKISVGPPVTLEFFAPLGFVGAKTGLIAWLLVQLVCLALSIWIFWIVSGKPDSRYHLFGYAFAPVLACLQAGQLGIFMLFGVVLFLLLYETRPFWAGVVLLPCTLKPHLFLPFVTALLLWAIFKRRYVLVAGFLISLIASCGLTLLFDRRLWIEYIDLMRSSRLMRIQLPTLELGTALLDCSRCGLAAVRSSGARNDLGGLLFLDPSPPLELERSGAARTARRLDVRALCMAHGRGGAAAGDTVAVYIARERITIAPAHFARSMQSHSPRSSPASASHPGTTPGQRRPGSPGIFWQPAKPQLRARTPIPADSPSMMCIEKQSGPKRCTLFGPAPYSF